MCPSKVLRCAAGEDSKKVGVVAKPKKTKKETPPQEVKDKAADDLLETTDVQTTADTPADQTIEPIETAGPINDSEPEKGSPSAEDLPTSEEPSKPLDESESLDASDSETTPRDTDPDKIETDVGTSEQPPDPLDDTGSAEAAAEKLESDEEAKEQQAEKKAGEEPRADAKPEETPAPPPLPPQRSSSFWPAVFGGIVAALLGFIAGRGDMLDAYLPRANAPEPVDLTPLTDEVAALSERLVALETAEAPAIEIADVPDLSAELGDVSQSLASVETSLQTLTTRLDEIEARPEPAAPAQQEDNSEELAALQSSIADLEARLAEEDARASVEAERLLARAALTRVVTAVENGEAFEPALGALEEVAPVEVPEALRTAALEGVPSMAELRETFPAAARAGLAAARAEVPETDVVGIGGFLRRQLSARSVTPREGTDPDAVLSRAEAALRAGDLDTALSETETLPEAARAAMQEWLTGAEARKAASDAAQSLSDSLTVN